MSSNGNPFGHRPRKTRAEREQRARVHECSHAIVACALAFERVWVDFFPQETDHKDDDASRARACVRYVTPSRWGATNRRSRLLALTFAGRVGEIRAFGFSDRDSCRGDDRDAERLLEPLGERRDQAIHEAHSTAQGIVEKHWKDVRWISDMAKSQAAFDVHAVRDGEDLDFEITCCRYGSEIAELLPRARCLNLPRAA
jgi:hypothetical protein